MRKRIEWDWEKVDRRTERAKVIGGWLIRSFNYKNEKSFEVTAESMVFVPDSNHDWTIVAPFNPSKPEPEKVDANEYASPT